MLGFGSTTLVETFKHAAQNWVTATNRARTQSIQPNAITHSTELLALRTAANELIEPLNDALDTLSRVEEEILQTHRLVCASLEAAPTDFSEIYRLLSVLNESIDRERKRLSHIGGTPPLTLKVFQGFLSGDLHTLQPFADAEKINERKSRIETAKRECIEVKAELLGLNETYSELVTNATHAARDGPSTATAGLLALDESIKAAEEQVREANEEASKHDSHPHAYTEADRLQVSLDRLRAERAALIQKAQLRLDTDRDKIIREYETKKQALKNRSRTAEQILEQSNHDELQAIATTPILMQSKQFSVDQKNSIMRKAAEFQTALVALGEIHSGCMKNGTILSIDGYRLRTANTVLILTGEALR